MAKCKYILIGTTGELPGSNGELGWQYITVEGEEAYCNANKNLATVFDAFTEAKDAAEALVGKVEGSAEEEFLGVLVIPLEGSLPKCDEYVP